MRTKAYAALTATLLLWASSFPAIKVGLTGYSSFQLAALRLAVASAALGCVAPLLGVRVPRGQDIVLILALGLLGVSSYHVLLNYGENLATAGSAAFISNIAPLFTTILARAVGERSRRRSWLGVVVGLAGVGLISASLPGPFVLNPGCLPLLLAALCWSLFFVLQRPLLIHYSPLEVTCYAVWTGTLLLVVFLPGAAIAARTADCHAGGDLLGAAADGLRICVLVLCSVQHPGIAGGGLYLPRSRHLDRHGLRLARRAADDLVRHWRGSRAPRHRRASITGRFVADGRPGCATMTRRHARSATRPIVWPIRS